MPNGTLYRWEDHNHGLEHKCGTCATVLSNPRAKKTCFGIHEEVCTRYHKTLFFVGQSHNCNACLKSIELHDKRHREIVKILQAIRRLDRNASLISNQRRKCKKGGTNQHLVQDSEAEIEEANVLYQINELNEATMRQQEASWDDRSSTLDNEDQDERTQPRDDTNARKATKADRKAAKNQVRFDVITKEDLYQVQDVLHPETRTALEISTKGQGLFDNGTIDENIAFSARTFHYSHMNIQAKKRMKSLLQKKHDSVDPKLIEELSVSLLKALGIKTKSGKASAQRKSLDFKLRTAVSNDLIALENEQAETMERMAGYWRYVNKRTYNQMVENNELWDWATGQKLLKVEEAELNTIEEEDEEETLNGDSPGATPESSPYDDKPIESPFNKISPLGSDRDPSGEENPQAPTQATYATSTAYADLIRTLTSLTFSPGRSPGPTLTFRVPSPHPEDDDPYLGPWLDCDQQTPVLLHASTTPAPTPTPYTGIKDTRTHTTASYIRSASPIEPLPTTTTLAPTPRWCKNKALKPQAPATTTTFLPSPAARPDAKNRFGNLANEVPAPRYEPKVADKTPGKGARARVLTLGVVREEVGVEEGWEAMRAGGGVRKAGKKRGKR